MSAEALFTSLAFQGAFSLLQAERPHAFAVSPQPTELSCSLVSRHHAAHISLAGPQTAFARPVDFQIAVFFPPKGTLRFIPLGEKDIPRLHWHLLRLPKGTPSPFNRVLMAWPPWPTASHPPPRRCCKTAPGPFLLSQLP